MPAAPGRRARVGFLVPSASGAGGGGGSRSRGRARRRRRRIRMCIRRARRQPLARLPARAQFHFRNAEDES